ncbi:MAG TPA: cysteine peptidase family C39 domain-containing protein [Burkholderiales bacterium]|nr:cysteine peptidase family C39 domain-containing protein [Burkholderiales bacterium]
MEYISQDWSKSLTSQELSQYTTDYIKYWSHRSCGLACSAMAIKALNNGTSVSINKLHDQSMAIYAFTIKGIIHEKLANILNKNEVNAKAITCHISEITKMLDKDNLFIASVSHLFSPEKKGGHLILVHGYEIIENKTFLKIQDPSPYGEGKKLIKLSEFEASYCGNGIMVWK